MNLSLPNSILKYSKLQKISLCFARVQKFSFNFNKTKIISLDPLWIHGTQLTCIQFNYNSNYMQLSSWLTINKTKYHLVPVWILKLFFCFSFFLFSLSLFFSIWIILRFEFPFTQFTINLITCHAGCLHLVMAKRETAVT